MRVIFILRVIFACVTGGLIVQAQTAREIVDSTAQVYQSATSYQVQAVSRSVRLLPIMTGMPKMGGPGRGPTETAPRYGFYAGNCVQFSLKLNKPDDWSLAVQTYGDTSSRSGAGKTPVPDVTFISVARSSAQSPVFGRLENGRFNTRPLPVSEFANELRTLLYPKNSRELVLPQFDPPSGGFSNARLFNVLNPELVDDGPNENPSLFKIRGKTSSGDSVLVWIEKARFLVSKTLVYNRESMGGPGGSFSGDPHLDARTMIVIQETLYRSQEINSAFQPSDFQLQTPSTLAALNPNAQEWTPQPVLMALGEDSPRQEKKPGETVAGTPLAIPAAPAVVDAQALTQEQMAGIVLIEGDGGTATGFMTKIRNVDFIVTNLHVLEGNKKLKMTTLRGEEIPMLGVFGAVGSDIAIIRIGSSQGDLKLAQDVFASSKIGDKVVVVGNRLGGGVATQTAGSIVGVGPTRVEVNANFEPGNSGSPIVNLGTNEVVGVATYSETRSVQVDDGASNAPFRSGAAAQVDKRWFGYRLDCVKKWEAIDLAKWNAQSERIEKFRETSDALRAVLRLDFRSARQNLRLGVILDGFESRYRAANTNAMVAANEVKDLFRVIRTISDDGVRDLETGDYYDYYRTCLYWESSIPGQLEYRKSIMEALKKYEANSSGYASRLRSGGS
ncbi:MAG: serine protease [Opitutaceae bacterium]|jgi:hypothetical protein